MKPFEIVNTQKIYSGPIFELVKETMTLPNGRETYRDVIIHNGAAVIIPVTFEKELVMVRQYRSGSGSMLLEFPAGKLDPGEKPEECALRELSEETGYCASSIKQLFTVYPVAAYCSEQITVFLAEGLKPGKSNLDHDEFIEIETYSLPELLKMIDNGEIEDMKTIMCILYYARTYS